MLLYQCLCQQWCQSVLVLMVMSVLVNDVCACVSRGVCGPIVSETQGGAAAQTQDAPIRLPVPATPKILRQIELSSIEEEKIVSKVNGRYFIIPD